MSEPVDDQAGVADGAPLQAQPITGTGIAHEGDFRLGGGGVFHVAARSGFNGDSR